MSLRTVISRLSLLGVVFLAACPKVPQETVLLSEELGGMIGSARSAHLLLVDEYFKELRAQVDDFVNNEWTPAFMANFVDVSGVLELVAQAPTPDSAGTVMLNFAKAAMVEIAEVRDAKMKALDDVERILRREVSAHYEDMRVVNQALTAHLESAADVTEIREDLAKRLGIETEDLIPLDEVNSVLEKFINAGGTVEEIVESSESLPNSIKKLLSGEGG